MAKDYAKTKPKKYKQRSNQTPQGGEDTEGRLWTLAGVLLVLFILGLFFLKHESARLAAPSVDVASTTKIVAKNTQTVSTSAAPQPKFDFYTMLPGGQSSSDNNPASNTTAADNQSSGATANNSPPASKAADNTQASAIPAPTSDFSDSTLQQTSSSTATPASSTSSVSVASDSAGTASTSSTPSSTSADSSAGTTNPAVTPSQTSSPSSKKAACNVSPQQQVSALVKMQLDEESDDQSLSSQHGIINPSKSIYVLQLGLFQDPNAADQMRAQLVIQGMEVKVKKISKNNQTYYRIWMGPYETKQEALKQQQSLKANSVTSEVIKQNS